jgi:protein TonB
MFEDSLFASKAANDRTPWTAIISFVAEGVFMGILVALPLFFTAALPSPPLKSFVQMMPLPRVVTVVSNSSGQTSRRDTVSREAVRVPRTIRAGILPDTNIHRDTSTNLGPPDLSEVGSGSAGTFTSLVNSRPQIMPTIERTRNPVTVSSGVAQGLLLEKVNPLYPLVARNAGVQGEVILEAVIGKDGRIENLHALSGHPFLIQAAIAAVQKWRYRPYMLNGKPVEVETRITVRFSVS